MKNFVTIFPSARNIHLIKDLGQVGNAIAQQSGWEAKVVCYKNDDNYDFINFEAKHLTVEFIEDMGRSMYLEKGVLDYLYRNAKEIEILNLYHLTKETIGYGLNYLKHNPNGKIYVKMDVVNASLQRKRLYSKNAFYQFIHRYLETKFLKKINLISVENPDALKLLKNTYPMVGEKAILVPNGVNSDFLNELFPVRKTYEEKENIVLAVGRIGASDKNFELLLSAFHKANLNKWKLIFVGPIENDFDKKVNELNADNIQLAGEISDRKALYEFYDRAKICCLSSPQESFGISFVEGMYFGNFIVGTDGMSSFKYISDNHRLGEIIYAGNETQLIRTLQKITNEETRLKECASKAHNRVVSIFSWNKIVKPLIERLNIA